MFMTGYFMVTMVWFKKGLASGLLTHSIHSLTFMGNDHPELNYHDSCH
jgi:hypothetical protein